MKLEGWIFNSETAHREGVRLTFTRMAGRTKKGTFHLICKREEVKSIIGDLRPGDFVEITIGSSQLSAAPATS